MVGGINKSTQLNCDNNAIGREFTSRMVNCDKIILYRVRQEDNYISYQETEINHKLLLIIS